MRVQARQKVGRIVRNGVCYYKQPSRQQAMPAPLSRKLFRHERAPLWRRWWVILLLLVLSTGLLATGFVRWALTPIHLDGKRSVEIYVPPGAGLRKVRADIAAAGGALPEWPFLMLAKVTRNERSIRVGAYEFADGVSPWGILQQLRRGRVLQASITIPEGWTFAQIRARIDANSDLRHDLAGMDVPSILKAVGAKESSPEGLFFPDNYFFDKRSSDVDLLRRAYQLNQQRLADAWSNKADGSPLKTPYEALILASIIEKESGDKADRQLIGAVFNNRLRIGMRLQSDPTVIYGLGDGFDGNLRKRDLQTSTPYNTYTQSGLPPSPIASASQASMMAATNPADSRVLYFVARGDGSSEFSHTLAAHNQAVRRYQLKAGKP